MKTRYKYAATVSHVVDGDTVDVDIDLGFHVHCAQRLRLNRLDAPELSTAAGQAAKAALVHRLPLYEAISVQTYKDPSDKYGRWLAEVYDAQGASINDWLLGTGLAVPYDGGKKP